ncbi:predicted protein [Sclerotinia sclerotiorum 1980 UF-70]|uniref:Uncharacterized protein n=1 Tax=Sclerotinia sclerotiorum (strain ATCC 18683 / 1980 / Ss-1) TaxID=665079 RepID=A7F424_SCLS1|nr:predicted protein [Sclerotinia sclerotiorum 1980 UF-70]EDN97495.1 predicted protein [Sclerotinia sclerotiorum 1980 UF-70]
MTIIGHGDVENACGYDDRTSFCLLTGFGKEETPSSSLIEMKQFLMYPSTFWKVD